MTPGPFDALSSLNHLETPGLQSASSRDSGADKGFAKHLSSPPSSERRVERSEPRSARPAQRDEPTPRAKATPTEPRATEGQPKPETALADKPTAPGEVAPTDRTAPAVAAAAANTSAATKEEHDDAEQSDATDVTDEVLLAASLVPVVAPVPISAETPVTAGEPQPAAVLVDEAPSTKPQLPKAEQGAAPVTRAPAAELVDPTAQVPTETVAPTAEAPTPEAVQPTTAPVEATSEVAPEATKPVESTNPRAPQRGKGKAEPTSAEEVVNQDSVPETSAAEVVEPVAGAEPVAPKARDGKKDRQRASDDAPSTSHELLEQAVASPTAPDGVAPIAATPTDAPPPPADASATSNSPPPPTATESTATPPTLAENASAASRLPQHLIARGSTRASGGAPVTNAEQMRLVQRVAKAFQAAQNREDGEIRLRLSPPELGSLKLELKLQGGVMTARVEAETDSAKAILLENLPTLKERLAEQGIQVEKFDVDLMDRRPQDQGQADSSPQRQRHDGPRLPRTAASGRELPTADVAATSGAARTSTNDGRLNVTV